MSSESEGKSAATTGAADEAATGTRPTTRRTRAPRADAAGPCAGCAQHAARVDELTGQLGESGAAMAALESRVFVWLGAAFGAALVAGVLACIAIARTAGTE